MNVLEGNITNTVDSAINKTLVEEKIKEAVSTIKELMHGLKKESNLKYSLFLLSNITV